jgi:KipI family sensor histidine kinase inhibitor
MTALRIDPLADDAWLISVGQHPDSSTHANVQALARRIRAAAPAWLRDIVPAYTSVCVFFDTAMIDSDAVHDWLQFHAHNGLDVSNAETSRVIEIPVCYGRAFGEDFDTVAAELELTSDVFIARHSAPLYHVAMIGFAPGFPYLSGLDPALALPRLTTPRIRVPAGSVGIGGAQTGVYPRESPGGWRLIGRTPLRLFDPQRAAPSLLTPGDRVRFVAIDDIEFSRLAMHV